MPARYAFILFGFVLSALMSFIVSGIATLHNAGFIDGFFGLWVNAWLPSWLVAFPIVLAITPVAWRLVALAVKASPVAMR